MKRIVKKFSDFSYLKEDIQNMDEVPNVSNELDVVDKDLGNTEVEESPLTQISEETGLPIESDDRGDFIKTESGVIRYFSETGYYNETNKKKYGEDISSVLNSIKSSPIPVSENKKHTSSCRSGCGCRTRRK